MIAKGILPDHERPAARRLRQAGRARAEPRRLRLARRLVPRAAVGVARRAARAAGGRLARSGGCKLSQEMSVGVYLLSLAKTAAMSTRITWQLSCAPSPPSAAARP